MCDNNVETNIEDKEENAQNEVIGVLKEISEGMKKFDENIKEMKNEFESKVKYDKHKDKIIDSLHEELQQYKDDLMHKLLRPVITDIIYTIDNNNKTIQAIRNKEKSELEPEKLVHIIEGVSEDLEDVLYRQGVEEFTYQDEKFDPKTQKIVKAIETDKEEKDRSIVRSVKKGYMFEDRVIRHELVEVYVYREHKE